MSIANAMSTVLQASVLAQHALHVSVCTLVPVKQVN
jgi:hypothetical protein